MRQEQRGRNRPDKAGFTGRNNIPTVLCKTFGARELVAADLFFLIRKTALDVCSQIYYQPALHRASSKLR